jgi:general secretion pathway protein J
MDSERGFTLIEVMVALLLMAVMSVLSWRALDSMVRTREALTQRGEQFDGVRALFSQWDEDCRALAAPDRWLAGVPVHLGDNQVALIRDRVDGQGVHHAVFVVYRYQDQAIQRLESTQVDTRLELQRNWAALQQGADFATLYSATPATLLTGVISLQGNALVDGFTWSATDAQVKQQTAVITPQGSVLLLGIELVVYLNNSNTPFRKIAMTGFN